MTKPVRLIVGISGASGAIFGVRLLEALASLDVETHLVMTSAAQLTLAHETDLRVADVLDLADAHYPSVAVDAPIASGSFQTAGMIVAPCSVRALSAIATGVTPGLLTRAADSAGAGDSGSWGLHCPTWSPAACSACASDLT
jgi:4-hydroxy-3-polyprenylbenzoate decarboxylase